MDTHVAITLSLSLNWRNDLIISTYSTSIFLVSNMK